MKHIIQKLWMVIAVLCASLSASAYDFEVDGIRYDITSFTDLTVSASSLSEDTKLNLVIPETVEFNGKTLKVTCVGENFALNNNTLQTVCISNGVSIIKNNSFRSCTKLTDVEIKSAEKVGDYAFYGCTLLNHIDLNDSLESIGKESFAECMELVNVILPNNLKSISYGLFRGCSKLTGIVIPSNVTKIESLAFCGCSSIENIIIPDNVLTADNGSFENCSSLRECTIGSGLNSIEKNLFKGCSKLETITFKFSTTPIELNDYSEISYSQDLKNHEYFFTYQSDLSLVPLKNVILDRAILEKKDKIISHYYSGDRVTVYTHLTYLPLFANHQYLQNISISHSISKNAFKGCNSLTNVILNNGVTSVGESAFADCTNLSSCEFGETIFEIGEKAFINCNNLSDFSLPDALEYLHGSCFENCKSLQQISIPNNVTSLGAGAFRGCENLKSIILGSRIKDIEPSCFKNCGTLLTISLLAKIPPAANDCFDIEHYYNTTLYVPISTSNAYSNSSMWRNFWNMSEKEVFVGDFEFDGIIYQIKDDNNVIVRSSSTGYAGNVIIPSVVTNNDKDYNVVSIGQAFKESHDLTNIDLPSSIKYIVEGAFANCSNLNQFTIPATIDCIGDTAFIGCTSLSSLIIEECDRPLIMGKGKFNKKVKIGGWSANYNPKSGEYFVLYYDGLFKSSPIAKIIIGRNLSYPHFEKYDLNELGEAYSEGSAYMGRYCIKYDSPFYGIAELKKASIGSKVSILGIPEFLISDWKENLIVSPDLFKGCNNLEIIESYASTAPIGSGFDDETYSTAFLFLPNGEKESYKNDESWKRFSQMMESHFIETESIAFDSEEILMDINENKTLSPIINPNDVSIKKLNWSSSTPSLVNVSEDGVVTSSSQEGEAIITASACDGTNLSASIKIIVQEGAGISDVFSDGRIDISVENGRLYIRGKHDADTVSIYNVQGQLIISTYDNEIELSTKGIYIIKVGSICEKIIL